MPPTTRTGLKKRYTFYSGDKHRAKAKILQDQSKRMKSKYLNLIVFWPETLKVVLVVLWKYCQIPMETHTYVVFFAKFCGKTKASLIVKLSTLSLSDFFSVYDVWFDPSFNGSGNLVVCALSDKDLKFKTKSWKYGQSRFLSS